MSRTTLGRFLAGILLALAVALGSVAPASASDATLKQTIKKLDRSFERKAEAVAFPEDPKSATFATEYAAATAKLDGLLVSYRAGIAEERGSTSKGREARKLLMGSANGLRTWLRTVSEIVSRTPAGQDASADDQAKAKQAAKGLKEALKDNTRAYKLLGMKAPKSSIPAEDGTTAA